MLAMVFGFLPWIILAVLASKWFITGLLLALVVAAATTFSQLRRGAPKILDSVTLAFFVCMVLGIVVFRWMTLATYMSLLVNLTLMTIAWGSLVAGVPFTIQYARERVAPERWHSPAFTRVNQYITAVWGLSFFLAALISAYRHLSSDPVALSKYAGYAFMLAAALFTAYFPAWYRTRFARAAQSGVLGGGE